jgi:hypothetical protein
MWNEFESKGLLNGDDFWEEGVAVSKICPTAVPLMKIKQMIHDGFYDFLRRPSFILEQTARTLKSSYRMEAVMNNLTRISDIRESLRNIA